KGTLVGVAAVSATVAVTNGLKSATDRTRPNGLAQESFPSGHTSSPAVHTRLASRNLEAIAMSTGTRWALDAGLYVLTIGTSWARIEAGWHYPCDTLFSIALGNFIASFVNDAFLGLDGNASVSLAPIERGAIAQLQVRF
ncbi:MAG: phosphatase PAP2 family protein, partial [Steroidobacteraceae bacterium]